MGDTYIDYNELDNSKDKELVDQFANKTAAQDHHLGAEPYMFEAEIEPNCPKANNKDELTLATVSDTNIPTISTDSTSAIGIDPLSARPGNRDWYVYIMYSSGIPMPLPLAFY